jgi:hypothetical protein
MHPALPGRRAVALMLGISAWAAVVAATAGPASAHEGREVGDYLFVVGFGEEPAFAGEPNRVQLIITEAGTEEPFVDLSDTLQVEISFGDESVEMVIEPEFVVGAFGEPGDYGANFVPSRPGQYSFRFFGRVGQQEVDETFTSGPETFNDVEDPAETMFPVQDPSVGELADRLEREIARLTESNGELAAQLDSAGDDSDPLALGAAIAALAVAVIALVVSLVAVRRKA